jgi:hypothetical protein
MGERQESSVMVSLGELLRDAPLRAEEERADAVRRARDHEERQAAALRHEREREAARVRADDEERARRAFEEQRRQAELVAVQQAALERARMEAGSRARLAEMAALQEHERQLRTLAQDGHKKRLQLTLAGLGVLLVAGAVAGAVTYARMQHDKEAAQAHARELESRIDDVDAQRAKVERRLASATDPAEVAALQAALKESQAKLDQLNKEANHSRTPGAAAPKRPQIAAPPAPQPPARACSKGDPMCPTVN